MKKNIIVAMFLGFALSSYAQQIPLLSHYTTDPYLVNPGAAGSNDYAPLRLISRSQWVGLKNAPSTQLLSGHMNSKEMGIGGIVFNDSYGNTKRTGLQLTYAYHLKLNSETKLGIGLSGEAFQFSMNQVEYNYHDKNDEVLTGEKVTDFVPNADAGVFVYNPKFYAGISVIQLLGVNANVALNESDLNRMKQHILLTGAYHFDLSTDLQLTPSLLSRYTNTAPIEFEGDISLKYRKLYSLGIGYKSTSAVTVSMLLGYKNILFGYAFDYNLIAFLPNKASHEFVLGINLNSGNNSTSLVK